MVHGVELVGVEISHLRGYASATVILQPRTLFVGPNNSGKSSLFALLGWAFGGEMAAINGDRDLLSNEEQLLLPSRDSRGKARRLTLLVRVADRRRHARFNCTDGVSRLRFTFSGRRCRLNVSAPRRSVTPTEPAALALLQELRAAYEFIWIPAGLGSGVKRISEQFELRLSQTLEKHLQTVAQTGTTLEYRKVKEVRDRAGAAATQLSNRLSRSLELGVGAALASITVNEHVELESIAELLAKSVRLRLTTGLHDAWGVDPDEVGSGLQSLILLALHRRRDFPDRRLILAVEEPEAHLHPSLQHLIARELLGGDDTETVLISTHSAAIVSEAAYGQTVLVKDRQFYRPAEASDSTRNAINSLLMQGRAAEAFFADTVLLVEGACEYRFFEAVRRRLVEELGEFSVERAFVLDVGSNTRFGPWFRLFRSYGDESGRPIAWVALTDGDSSGPLLRGLADSGQTVPSTVRSALTSLGATAWDEVGVRTTRAAAATAELMSSGLRSTILPVDLEWALISDASGDLLTYARESLGATTDDRHALARRLGSKVGTGRTSSSAQKDPWIRAELGQRAHWRDLSAAIRAVIEAWLGGLTQEPMLQRL